MPRIEVNDIDDIDDIDHQKTKLCQFLKCLFEFMNANDLTEDLMLRRLGDDIYILYQTIGRHDAQLWCTSRQVSQGRQQSYTANDFIHDDYDVFASFAERNQNTKGVSTIVDHRPKDAHHAQQKSPLFRETTYSILPNASFAVYPPDATQNSDSSTNEIDFWNFDNHRTRIDTSYATQYMVDMMLSVSKDEE
jgi:hypothetical protein